MDYQLHLLGPFRLERADGTPIEVPSTRAQALLAHLALARGAPVPRSRLWSLFWEDRAEEQARNSLRQLLSALKKAIGGSDPAPFTATAQEVAALPDRLTTDIDSLAGDDSTCPLPDFAELLDGLHLSGAQVQSWITAERERLRALYLDCASRRIAELANSGDTGALRRTSEQALRADAAHEVAHRALIGFYAAQGDRPRALRQYEICRTALRDAYDVDPDPRTEALVKEVRAGTGPRPTHAPPPRIDMSFDAGRLSIIVLPFEARTPADTARFFAENLADSVTTGLSRYHDLSVISYGSSLAYRDASEPVPDICRRLGVRYALTGSLTQVGDRVRVAVQLIDGSDGRIHWTEQFDEESEDPLKLQDALTQVIVTRLGTTHGGQLRRAWGRSRLESQPAPKTALDCLQRALEEMDSWTPDSILKGRALLEEALRLDPDFAKARAKLAWNHLVEASEGWSDEVEARFQTGMAIARDAVARDPHEPWAVWVLGGAEIYDGHHDAGLAGIERAIELNPNDADLLLDYGYYLSLSGEPGLGLRAAEKALRLHPHYPAWYLTEFMQIQFDSRRYNDAVSTASRLAGHDIRVVSMLAAAAHAALGHDDQAKACVKDLQRLKPEATIASWLNPRILPYRRAEDREHLARNLRKAGLPDG